MSNIPQVENGEIALSVRGKINKAITEANKVEGVLPGAEAARDTAISAADSAEADAVTASAALNQIRGAYYGALSDDPATDPLGNPPDAGDRYYNTTAGEERVYTGTDWVSNDVSQHEAATNPHSQYVQSTDVTHIVTLTQAEYDAIETPDPATLYVIEG